MIKNTIIIDNFLDNVDEIRNQALLLKYTKSKPNVHGWKGYRCLEKNELTINLQKKIKDELIKNHTKFEDCKLDCFFHYTLEDNNTGTDNIHRDTAVNYAGVLYLTPNPPNDSGTSFYNELNIETYYLENIYNRLVIYPAYELHSLKNAFGNNINNGRLTFTLFFTKKRKINKTII
jgi:hypothetical protein